MNDRNMTVVINRVGAFFFVVIVMLLHLLISTKRISRTSYTSLHSFREIYQFCFHNVKQRGISLILLDRTMVNRK